MMKWAHAAKAQIMSKLRHATQQHFKIAKKKNTVDSIQKHVVHLATEMQGNAIKV